MTDTIAPIDAQTAYDLLAAAVQLAGEDHVVRACQYVDDDALNPCCIVGTALAIHGVPLADMVYNNHESFDSFATGLDYVNDEAVDIFVTAQTVQDGRGHEGRLDRTWGAALAAAKAELDDLNA